MNIETIRDYCLSLPGTTEDCAFGPENILFRICNKIFACIDTERPYLVVLKCEPDKAVSLRDAYHGITPAWHWNKRHWNDVRLDADVENALILQLIDHSYAEVVRSLPQKTLYNFPDLPEGWTHRHLPQTDSLMNDLHETSPTAEKGRYELLTTDFQTAGRGQRGTSWESEAEKNLLLGFRFSPDGVKASQQFLISEVVALAACRALRKYAGTFIEIKWPNDIYFENKKIAGMLIDHTICGTEISTTFVGIGINVNQESFLGNAPNPISLRQILKKEVDRAAVLRNFLKFTTEGLKVLKEGNTEKITHDYQASLYRRKGMHIYKDAQGPFKAHLESVADDGTLLLRDEQGNLRSYAFKEVEFIIRLIN